MQNRKRKRTPEEICAIEEGDKRLLEELEAESKVGTEYAVSDQGIFSPKAPIKKRKRKINEVEKLLNVELADSYLTPKNLSRRVD